MRHFESCILTHIWKLFIFQFISYYWWDFIKSGWISLTFLREDIRTSLPLKQLISVNRLSFPHTLIPSLVFCQTVFLLVLVKYNMLLETASWKHKLQSHVPLLYSSSTCNLSAKISKLATPNSPRGAQAGIGTKLCSVVHTAAVVGDIFPWIRTWICQHGQSSKLRLWTATRLSTRWEMFMAPTEEGGRYRTWLGMCLYPVWNRRTPQQQNCNSLAAGHTQGLKIKVPLPPYLSLKTTPSASGGAIDSWKGVLK